MEVTNYPTTQSLNNYNVSYEVSPHSIYYVISSISQCGGLLEHCGQLVAVLCVSCLVSSVAAIGKTNTRNILRGRSRILLRGSCLMAMV